MTTQPLGNAEYPAYSSYVQSSQGEIVALGRQHTGKKSHSEPEMKRFKVDENTMTYVSPVSNTTARIASRISVFEMGAMSAYGIAAELGKVCIYGYYCGSSCHAQAGAYRPGGLDGACYDHDRCLSDPRMTSARYYCRAPGLSGMKCTCEKRLSAAAWSVYNAGKRCSWYAVWCVETEEVAAAWAVGKAMDQRIRCGGC